MIKSGITNAYDLSKSIPALTITSAGGGGTEIYMRGVGNRTNSAYIDPAISISYDGVVMGRASSASSAVFFDLERVEVLKGPQGTLYGRNATGGAINILPVKPSLGETGGFINASIGNFNAKKIQGALNLATGDNSALRLSVNSVKRDGYNNDGTQDEDTQGIRIQYFTEVNDNLNIRVGADYSDIGGVGTGLSYEGFYDGAAGYAFVPSGLDINEGPRSAAADAFRQTQLAAPGFGFLTPIQDEWYMDHQYSGINAEINYQIDTGTFTFVPAWRKVEQDSKFSGPGFNSGWFQETDEQSSLELRFASESDGALNYILGAYYFNEEIEGNNTFNQEYVLPLQEFTQETTSWAAFTQLTFDLTDDKRIVAGIRYTDDEKKMEGNIQNYITFCGGLPNAGFTTPPASFALGCQIPGNLPIYPTFDTPEQTLSWLIDGGWVDPSTTLGTDPGQALFFANGAPGAILKTFAPVNESYSENKVTWRAAFEWDIAEESLFYVSFETGYRAGGLQLTEGPTSYQPEFLDAFTIGSKNRFLDGRLQVNLEAFLLGLSRSTNLLLRQH